MFHDIPGSPGAGKHAIAGLPSGASRAVPHCAVIEISIYRHDRRSCRTVLRQPSPSWGVGTPPSRRIGAADPRPGERLETQDHEQPERAAPGRPGEHEQQQRVVPGQWRRNP